ncbi:MAG: helix-turn-helix transcriptional regulator [Myxococcales bacterium]|nr:helix-turn-helix transcriptional regulator [Myxococcales bacterium]
MDPARPLPPVDLLAELLQGYRHPAAATDEHGVVVFMNPAAVNEVDQATATASADAKDWPLLAVFRTPDGQTFMLRRPAWAVDASTPAPALPPRLAKIAALVIDGLTDKQISQRVGLTFSTVRTYVRQIYRRMGVHSRVGLVNASRTKASQSTG